MAERTGLEPATPGVTGRYSNQLNYRSVILQAILHNVLHERCMSLQMVGVAGVEPATFGL